MAHWIARIGSARQRRDIDDVWLPARGRAFAARGVSVRDPGPCQHVRPSGVEGAPLSTAPQGTYARSVNTQSFRNAVGALAQQAPEHAVRRNKSGLTALSAVCGS